MYIYIYIHSIETERERERLHRDAVPRKDLHGVGLLLHISEHCYIQNHVQSCMRAHIRRCVSQASLNQRPLNHTKLHQSQMCYMAFRRVVACSITPRMSKTHYSMHVLRSMGCIAYTTLHSVTIRTLRETTFHCIRIQNTRSPCITLSYPTILVQD